MKFVIYYRVSTQRQGRSGLGLEAQRNAVQQFLSRSCIVNTPREFTDIETGRNNDRPNLSRAIQCCKETGSTLIIAKLDRLSRDVGFIFNLRDELQSNGVDFIALDIPDVNTLTLGVLASMAQHESELISQRTKAAIQAKRERQPDWKPGTPENLNDSAREKGRSAIMRNAREDQSVRHAWHYIKPRMENLMTYQEIAEGLNSEGYRTRRGKLFHPAQVRSIWLRFYDKEIIKT